jgi:hypothetical protein
MKNLPQDAAGCGELKRMKNLPQDAAGCTLEACATPEDGRTCRRMGTVSS